MNTVVPEQNSGLLGSLPQNQGAMTNEDWTEWSPQLLCPEAEKGELKKGDNK